MYTSSTRREFIKEQTTVVEDGTIYFTILVKFLFIGFNNRFTSMLHKKKNFYKGKDNKGNKSLIFGTSSFFMYVVL